MKITSDFAILDVKNGRKKLSKEVETEAIPVTIKGYITKVWGADDGESQEFQVDIKSITTTIEP